MSLRLAWSVSSTTSGLCQETLSKKKKKRKKAGAHYVSETLFIASLEVLLTAASTGVKTGQRAIFEGHILRPGIGWGAGFLRGKDIHLKKLHQSHFVSSSTLFLLLYPFLFVLFSLTL